MSISTLQNKKKGLPTPIVYALGIIGVGLIVYFGGEILRNIGNLKGRSSIDVAILTGEAEVYINGEYMGKTPYQSQDITPGENTVELRGESTQYQTSLTFLPNSKKYMHHVGINRDLGVSEYFSAGNEFWFEKDSSGNILRIISEPSDATVFIDNNDVGKTPFIANNLTEGNYDLRIEAEGFESQEARINVKDGYTLNIKLQLFPAPVPEKVEAFEGSPNLFDLSSSDSIVLADTETWVRAIIHWNESRGINLKGVGVSKDMVFDYFIDYKGNLYNASGVLIQGSEEFEKLESAERGAYLGRMADGQGLTTEAKETFEILGNIGLGTAVPATGNLGKIQPTGTGWLRVRDAPGLTGLEVAKVDVGSSYEVLEEGDGWVKIKATETIDGWVSADYIQILEVDAQ